MSPERLCFLTDSSRQQPVGFVPEFIEALWPAIRATDSPLRRQKIWVARCVQLGMLLMVGTALARTIATKLDSMPVA